MPSVALAIESIVSAIRAFIPLLPASVSVAIVITSAFRCLCRNLVLRGVVVVAVGRNVFAVGDADCVVVEVC